MRFYLASSNGFYDQAIHGASIPSGAVEVSDELYESVMAGQALGKIIVADNNGNPSLTDPAPLTANQQIIAQIGALEATVTARRYREATLGIDNGWLDHLNASIDTLRAQITH